MTITISPEDSRDDIVSKIGSAVDRDTLRVSDTRRRRLEAGSQRRTRVWDLGLDIDERHPTAHCEQRVGKPPKIVVTGREIEQAATDLDAKTWDFAAQRGLGWHEDGHVLYTDAEDVQTRIEAIETGDRGTARQIWNSLEDAAIEKQLSMRWSNCYDVLRVLRANLFMAEEPGIQDVERGGRVFPVAHAVHACLHDQWAAEVYNLNFGTREKLYDPDDDEHHFANDHDRDIFMDEIRPKAEAVVPKVLTEPDAIDRNRIIFEFIEDILPLISEADGDGKSQMNRHGDEAPDGMPNDAGQPHHGEARDAADQLGDLDPDDIEVVDPDDLNEDELENVQEVEVSQAVRDRIESDVTTDQQQEAGVTDELVDELEEAAQKMAADGLRSDTIQVASENWDHNEARYQQAKRAAGPLANILRNRLQHERRTERRLHQRRGRFTGRGGATVRARRGSKEVLERVDEPDEKDYRFMFLLDRSGSMGGSNIQEAEKALGMLAIALEEVGVDVMVMELYSSTARIAKPSEQPVEKAKGRIFNGQTSGGTPIGKALDMARARMLGEEHAYMVVVTDGAAGDPEIFEEVIQTSPMPVLGVNIGSRNAAGTDQYTRSVETSSGVDLRQRLQDLVQEVMFT